MTLTEVMKDIKQNYSGEILDALTDRDRSGRGYVCPICGSGSGKNGTGLTAGTKNPNFFQCWNCGFKGDALDLLGAVNHITEPVEQVREAERILHKEFLQLNNSTEKKREAPKKAESKNKNNSEITVKKGETMVNKTNFDNEVKQQEEAAKIRDFIEQSKKRLITEKAGRDYLKRRGISEQTAYKYGIGYVAKYPGMNTPAVIIPTGQYSFTARSITTDEGGRKVRKRNAGGQQEILNIQALREPGAVIFLCEGEFDCLSIIESGYNAICTGGGTSEGPLKDAIKESLTRPEMFVILPDNDRLPDGSPNEEQGKGFDKGVKFRDALLAAGIPAMMIDTRKWPPDIKDANDYLVKDRAGFKELLRGIVEPIEHKALQSLGRVSDSVQLFIDHITGKSRPVSTGFNCIDKLLDGGVRPSLIVLGAISSLGKTSLALNIADNMAESGQNVIFFSLEMSRFELMAKSVSRKTFMYCKAQKQPAKYAKSNIGISDFDRYNYYSAAELDLIDKAQESYEHGAAQNLYIVEGVGNIGTAAIREHVRRHIAITGNTPVCVIDYLQILAPEDPRSSDKQAVDKNIVELKRISRDFNVPMIVISSFNRESYWQPVSMSSFKESGGIEFSADLLIALQYAGMDYERYAEGGTTKFESDKDKHRTQRLITLFENIKAETNSGGKVDIDVKVLKNRSGRKDKTVISYYPRFNCFIEETKQ